MNIKIFSLALHHPWLKSLCGYLQALEMLQFLCAPNEGQFWAHSTAQGSPSFLLSAIPSSTFTLVCYSGKREIILYFILTFLLFHLYLIQGIGIFFFKVTNNCEKFGSFISWEQAIHCGAAQYSAGDLQENTSVAVFHQNRFSFGIHLFLQSCEFWQIGGAGTNSCGELLVQQKIVP